VLGGFAPLLALAAFVCVLGAVTWWRVAGAAAVIGQTVGSMDLPIKRAATASAVAAIALAIALITLGLDPSGAFGCAALSGFGAWVALHGVLGLEGALLEPHSLAVERQEKGLPPSSSPRGRAVALVLGLLPLVGVAWSLWPRN